MHYRNGRVAVNGDKVIWFSYNGPVVGILHDATPGQDLCNGQLALIKPGDPIPNLKECLHLDDVMTAIKAGEESIYPADSSKKKGI